MIRTVVAVTAVLGVLPDEVSSLPTATQSPTLMSDSFALTSLVKVVAPVQDTATWPSTPWTCAVLPSTAATLPFVPGSRPPGPFGCPFCWVCGPP